ncbi:hypothetical protein BU25DRAFT_414350, partial [Macroventuria anomochaeta]
MPAAATSSRSAAQLLAKLKQQQEAQAACLLTLVAYIEHPAGSFLLCPTCSIAI